MTRTGRPTTTGRFGTGFLTTHLLSERVIIKGVTEGKGFSARKFKLSLDRSGQELEEIIAAVQAAKDSLHDLDDRPPFAGYTPGRVQYCFPLPARRQDRQKRGARRARLTSTSAFLTRSPLYESLRASNIRTAW